MVKNLCQGVCRKKDGTGWYNNKVYEWLSRDSVWGSDNEYSSVFCPSVFDHWLLIFLGLVCIKFKVICQSIPIININVNNKAICKVNISTPVFKKFIFYKFDFIKF